MGFRSPYVYLNNLDCSDQAPRHFAVSYHAIAEHFAHRFQLWVASSNTALRACSASYQGAREGGCSTCSIQAAGKSDLPSCVWHLCLYCLCSSESGRMCWFFKHNFWSRQKKKHKFAANLCDANNGSINNSHWWTDAGVQEPKIATKTIKPAGCINIGWPSFRWTESKTQRQHTTCSLQKAT